MAFETSLVAILQVEGKFKVHSQLTGTLRVPAMKESGLFHFHDVSDDTGYYDEAAIIAKNQLPDYFLDSPPYQAEPVRNWFKELPKEVAFIIVHRAEWESGLPD
jgi:hypothetical protein